MAYATAKIEGNKIISTSLWNTDVFEIVEKIPSNYLVWNIGENMGTDCYIPICQMLRPLLRILAATRDATQIKKGAQWCSLTHYMSMAHITTLRAVGALMNIGLRKRDLIFHVSISQEPEFWHL